MEGYVPGQQPGLGERVIKLNTNENPYPPSPAAMSVLSGIDADALRRYPDPTARAPRKALAKVLDVPVEWTLAGNGSDDLLTMIFRAAASSDRRVAYPTPTYVLYRTLASIQCAGVVEVPFDEAFTLPADALAKAGAAVTIVASPNSPSGTVYSSDELAQLAEAVGGMLVIDEAYTDFADSNALELVPKYDNVIVLRTLSKGYSLAGLRMGFGIAQNGIIEGLAKVKDSYNVDAIAAAVATAAIEDQAHKNANAEKVKASRGKLSGQLAQLGFGVWASGANFLLARPPAGDAGYIYEALKGCGILVRYFNQDRLDDKLRITVGTDRQNAALLAAMGEILQR